MLSHSPFFNEIDCIFYYPCVSAVRCRSASTVCLQIRAVSHFSMGLDIGEAMGSNIELSVGCVFRVLVVVLFFWNDGCVLLGRTYASCHAETLNRQRDRVCLCNSTVHACGIGDSSKGPIQQHPVLRGMLFVRCCMFLTQHVQVQTFGDWIRLSIGLLYH